MKSIKIQFSGKIQAILLIVILSASIFTIMETTQTVMAKKKSANSDTSKKLGNSGNSFSSSFCLADIRTPEFRITRAAGSVKTAKKSSRLLRQIGFVLSKRFMPAPPKQNPTH